MERMTTSASSEHDILEGLDDAQRRAATSLHGPVRIVAGAGAGKTRTVTRRIAYGCATGEWEPSGALAVTFSVKAAAEMRARLAGLGVEGVRAATFHSAALRQLRRAWNDICDAPFPQVIDDARPIVQAALRRATAQHDHDELTVRDSLAELNWAKVSLIAPEDYPRVCAALHRTPPAGFDPTRFADIYLNYEREKTDRGGMDFNDILLVTCHVIDDYEDVARDIRRSIRWLTVDEYQDVSPLQHRLLTRWLGDNRNVAVVGDAAQTIYSFAGASSYDLLAFADQFGPLAADVSLNTDYRSTPQIVGYANKVLASSPQRADYLRLVSARENGPLVSHTVYDTDAQEARGVAGRIARMIASGAHAKDFAVLTRVNAQQTAICSALRQCGLHFRQRRDAGWDVHADELSLLADATQTEASIAEGSVTVSTIHASKGLEFAHVFIIGCSEGLLPYGAPSDADALEEERRLMYVGVTRAEEDLHISYAKTRDGMGRPRVPSRFLR